MMDKDKFTTSKLTIFEGPDGGGKTTAARQFAELTGAKYIHHGAYKGEVKIGRHYVESILPALHGCQDIVLDRSWHSEKIYGDAYRNGEDRLGKRAADLTILGNMCGAVMVMCLPPLAKVLKTFNSRRSQEMLSNDDQMSEVYFAYKFSKFGQTVDNSSNIVVVYDYTSMTSWSPRAIDSLRPPNVFVNNLDTCLQMFNLAKRASSYE